MTDCIYVDFRQVNEKYLNTERSEHAMIPWHNVQYSKYYNYIVNKYIKCIYRKMKNILPT